MPESGRRAVLGVVCLMIGGLISGQPASADRPEAPEVRVENVRRAFDNGEHNAFTDLIRFQGQFYLTFRSCPEGHMVHPTSSILVLRSSNAEDWEQVHRFRVPRRDTRDPHFVVFQDQLFVYAGTWYCGDDSPSLDEYDLNKHLGYAARTSDGVHWESPIMLEGTYGHYIWRAESHDGRVYLCGRRKHEFAETPRSERGDVESAMLESDDGRVFRTRALFQTTQGDETAFRILPDGELLAIGRRGRGPAQLIRSQAPFVDWQRSELDRYVGGPLLARWVDRWLVGGRQMLEEGQRTTLYWLVDGELVECARLPSGGDNSYPGFVALSPRRGVVSWYSSHEQDAEGNPQTSIYLADLVILE